MPSLAKASFFKRTPVRIAFLLACLPLGMVTAKVSDAVAKHYELGLLEGLLASIAIGLACGLAPIGFCYLVWIRREEQSSRG